MKKILLFMAACGLVTVLHAQVTFKPGAGINVTDFSKDVQSGESKGKIGWQLGGSFVFGNKVYFEPGLFYVGKSTEVRSDLPDADEFKANIKGFRVPVAVGINLIGKEQSTVAVRAFGGASGFFITSVGDDIDEDEINKTNWGVFAGAGLDFSIIFVEAAYEWSVTNVQKDVSLVDVGKSRSFYVTAGLRLNLSKKK